jgi:glycine hydroxymethyltransferase
MGNLLTDKYAEGYPGHRFYAGCENIDAIEHAAVDEVKNLFSSDHAYVQPHSGIDANLVAFWAILIHRIQNGALKARGLKSIDEMSPEQYEELRLSLCQQKVMGLSLNSGGHLTHGYRHNISSKMMRSIPYDVNRETGLIDYAELKNMAIREKPLILIAGYSAYPRLIDFAVMREIADAAGAFLMVDMAHFAGLVAGKVMQGDYDPVPFAHIVTSTTHKTLRGPRGGFVLCKEELRESVDKGCPLVLGGPLPHVMAAKAIAFKEARTPEYSRYAHQVVKNAKALAERLMKHGVKLTTGGTDNHLLVIDVSTSFGLTGRQAEMLLREARMTLNRNAIPFDNNGPWYTSGLRLGTAALTTLGMKETEMGEVADILYEFLKGAKPATDEKTGGPSRAKAISAQGSSEKASKRVAALLQCFPLYPELVIEG